MSPKPIGSVRFHPGFYANLHANLYAGLHTHLTARRGVQKPEAEKFFVIQNDRHLWLPSACPTGSVVGFPAAWQETSADRGHRLH